MRLSLRNRSLVLIGCLAFGAAVALAAINSGAIGLLLGAFDKDTTLTGRTYLWAQGWLASQQAPIIGVGYQAYWVQGFPEPERLWEEFYITARAGFHFHNTYIETLVELGAIGTVLITFVLVRVLIGHTRRLMTERSDPAAQMLLGIGVLLFVRSFVEVDVISPYHVGSFLLVYAAALIAIPHSVPLPRQTPQAFKPGPSAAQ
jgi:exopolysaccharide production protein ExoQ